MEYKISVILPVYNMGNYIQECLDTVKSQTLKEIEIICVDDGSTDNSVEIIQSNIQTDDRIVLIKKENGGAASARNAALRVARGEFVAFMDPDDWYPESNVLETLYTKAKENEVLICGGSFSEISEKKGLVTEFTGVRSKYTFKDEGIVYYKDYQFDYGYHRFIYNCNFLRMNDIYFPPYLRYQDPPFFVKAMITAEKFYAINKIVYKYRVGHQKVNWTEKKLSDLLMGLRDNIKMSAEAELSELHTITVERLGRVYKDMYASNIYDFSADFLRLLMSVDQFIKPELLLREKQGERYVDAVPNIIKRAIEIGTDKDREKIECLVRENKALKKKNREISHSRSYRIGRIVTYLPRKIKRFLKKIGRK